MTDLENMYPNTGRYLDEDGASRNVIEQITGAFRTTESDHTANHLGYGFKTHIEVSNLASAQALSWCWTGPSTLFVHLKNFALSVLGSSGKLEILRGADVTVNTGAAVPFTNTNDNSEIVAQSTLKATPTYTGGTRWDQVLVLIDSTTQNIGSQQFQSNPYEELVTKDGSEKYIIKLTNIGNDSMAKAWIKIFFYEEPLGII
jgi:hypothetical protein